MGRKDAASAKIPMDQYRKQIGKQDYKKTKPMLKAARLKAEAKKTAPGIKGLSQPSAASMAASLSTEKRAFPGSIGNFAMSLRSAGCALLYHRLYGTV
ncbi:PREDICTED: triple QxxK/R motif-containing protein isoform X1 [Thamnophis sirtalis]|uniref:Triple QxxK/R motif-containing protein n=1 Tax=Thamnophis sirtalis TaxID=35019 RepID=A0A6I9YCM1_9SAUR|nr:PREDICTED: triple QxxK/R motif-containing protein isoform X1 [Thamnophis sirtalis]